MSQPILDSSTEGDLVNTTGSFDSADDENDALLHLNEDPDLEWILDAASLDSSSCCDHSDHEHIEKSSSSSSEDDIEIIAPEGREALPNIVKNTVNPPPPVIRSAQTIASSSALRGNPLSPRLPQKINGDNTILNLYAATVAKAVTPRPQGHDQRIAPVVTSPRRKPTESPSRSVRNKPETPIAPSVVDPPPPLIHHIAPDVTSPTKTKHSTDDPLLKLFASTVQKASSSSSKKATAKDDSFPPKTPRIRNRSEPRAPSYEHRKEPRDTTPQPQYLQLEIARELDSKSRRFQLAIQSHISQLTMGSSTGNDDDDDDEGNTFVNWSSSNTPNQRGDDDDDEGNTFVNWSSSNTPNQRGDDDDDEGNTFVNWSSTPSRPGGADEDDEGNTFVNWSSTPHYQDDVMEVSLDESRRPKEKPVAEFRAENPVLQFDHAWMRNKLWGPVPQRKATTNTPLPDAAPEQPGVKESAEQANSSSDPPNNMEYEGVLAAWNVPTVSRHSKCLEAWRNVVLHGCIVYLVPFTYQMGWTLPQLYFLIELVHTFDMNVQLAGLYLCMACLCRLTMALIALRAPLASAVTGTLLAMTGFALLIVTSSVPSFEVNAGTDVLPSIVFVVGSILLGCNEINLFLQTIVLAWKRESLKVDPNEVSPLCQRQRWVLQISMAVSFALGGLIYEYFDFFGIAVAGIGLMGVQLTSVVAICLLCPRDDSQPFGRSLSQLCRTDSECFMNFLHSMSYLDDHEKAAINKDDEFDRSGENMSDFKLQPEHRSSSFRSILSSELETIEETPHTESDAEEDSSRRNSYLLRSSPYGGESDASGSSVTPRHDNRAGPNKTSELCDSRTPSSIFPDPSTANPPAEWMDYVVVLFSTVHPLLNGLVFGTTTLYLLDEMEQAKYAIGLIYAASSLCDMLPSLILSLGIVEKRLLQRFKLCWTLCLFGCTYMVLLTAIPNLSAFLVGALTMNVLLGIYVPSLHQYARQRRKTSNAFGVRAAPYVPWFRNGAHVVALVLAPILYHAFPRLPYMVGSGCSCLFTVLVCSIGGLVERSSESSSGEGNDAVAVNIETRPGQEGGRSSEPGSTTESV